VSAHPQASIGSPPATPRSPSHPSGGEGDAPTHPLAAPSFLVPVVDLAGLPPELRRPAAQGLAAAAARRPFGLGRGRLLRGGGGAAAAGGAVAPGREGAPAARRHTPHRERRLVAGGAAAGGDGAPCGVRRQG